MDFRGVEAEFGVSVGVCAWALDDPSAVIQRAADVPVPAASTIKLYILAALLDTRGLDGELVMRAEDQVGGSGVLNSLTPGRPWAIRDLATLMMTVSDNTATNMIIDLLGVDMLNGWTAGHGFSGTSLAGKLMQPGRRVSSMTTPADLAACMARLWQGELLDAEATAAARGILAEQHYKDSLGRELGFDAFGEGSGVRIASKSGSITGVRNEVAVIGRGDREYVVAIMTSGCRDERFWPDNPGNLAVSRVNAMLFERFMGQA